MGVFCLMGWDRGSDRIGSNRSDRIGSDLMDMGRDEVDGIIWEAWDGIV